MQGRILSNRYLLDAEIGIGGMGRVFRATDLRTGGTVAVKVPHPALARNPEYIERLTREAQIGAAIYSPRIVRVLDRDAHEGLPFLVMEYVPGETLAELLRERGRLDPAEALTIALEIARAMEAAHARGVVHRDLKPQNIKVVDGEVKVLDFGVAKAEGLTGGGLPTLLIGTPEYCAPERADGHSDIRSDIYSLGIMLFEMLEGYLPFQGMSPSAVMRKHEHEPPPELSAELPLPVHLLVQTCLAKRPDERYPNPRALSEALLAALRTLPEVEVSRVPATTAPATTAPARATPTVAAPWLAPAPVSPPPAGVPTTLPPTPLAVLEEAAAPGLPMTLPPAAQPALEHDTAEPRIAAAGEAAAAAGDAVIASRTRRGRRKVWLAAASAVAVVAFGAGAVAFWPEDRSVSVPDEEGGVVDASTAQGQVLTEATPPAGATTEPDAATAPAGTEPPAETATAVPSFSPRNPAALDGSRFREPRQRAVAAAIVGYNNAVVDALRTLDTGPLAAYAGAEELQLHQRQVDALRADGRYLVADLLDLRVEGFEVREDGGAEVRTRERWRSVEYTLDGRVIPETRRLDTLDERYTLRREGERWVVTALEQIPAP